MIKINLVYIDDGPEPSLARYLDSEYHNSDVEINYSDIIFEPGDGYERLLYDSKVQSANIIIVDSWLFENKTASAGKFTGEEFKLVLKKFYPFIEVIVITQNGTDANVQKIEKYNPTSGKTSTEHYEEKLSPFIDEAIQNIIQYQFLSQKLSENESWETVLKEKVLDTLSGAQRYDELSKTDINNLIAAFKEIQESLDGK